MSDAWPDDVTGYVRSRLGPDISLSSPGGMSGATVKRVIGKEGSLIVKGSANPREWHVYTRLGETLSEAGIPIPHLYTFVEESAAYWIVLEDIPTPLPADRWLADPEVLSILRGLHEITAEGLPLHPDRYRPSWPEDLTERTLSLLGTDVSARARRLLDRARSAASSLFEPMSLISGDPNPTNWRMRHDGSLVLIDWERCTLASPAIDLAITVPGLGDMTSYERVGNGRFGSALVAVAKVWAVVEFLSEYAAGAVEPSFDVHRLGAEIPDWLESLDL